MQLTVILAVFGLVLILSLIAAPRRASVEGFSAGRGPMAVRRVFGCWC